MIFLHSRGHKTYVIGEKEYYFDTGKEVDDNRPCVRCGCKPTPEGYDACLGHIKGARAACCGHGVHEGYVVMKDGTERKLTEEERHDKALV